MDLVLLIYSIIIILTVALFGIFIFSIITLLRARRHSWKSGAVPTFEEIESEKVRDLANRLKGNSDKETLTNILEWQHRNINFWFERFPMPQITGAFLVGVVISSVFLYAIFVLGSDLWLIACFFFFAFLAMTITSIAITLVHICYGRKLKLSQFWNTIRSSIAVDDILENRLCVCRDYAKLNACLLSNRYSESDIYFAHTSNHVAVGLVSNGQLYMLDQKLPILTIEQWDKREKSKETIYKLKDGAFEQVKDLSKYRKNQQSLEELIKKLKDLGITISSSSNAKPINVIKWRKGALLYSMNDEIVNYSLAHRIKYEVTNDLLDFEKIRIEIQENGKDLEFLIKNH